MHYEARLGQADDEEKATKDLWGQSKAVLLIFPKNSLLPIRYCAIG